MLALLSLLLALPTAADPVQTGIRLVGLSADRAPRQLDPTLVATADRTGLTAVWIWSQQVPPRRVAADALAAVLAEIQRDEHRASRALRVRLAEPPGPSSAPFDVIAAPRRMFEEVPESWLPRWTIPRSGSLDVPRELGLPWRLRLVGAGRGSGWVEVPVTADEALLVHLPAEDRRLRLVGGDGALQPGAFLTVLEDTHGTSRPAILCQLLGDEGGTVELPSLPGDLQITLVGGAPSAASLALRARVADLPEMLRLPTPARVRGRLLDGDRRPISGVEVRSEGWLDAEIPVRFSRRTVSGDDGSWEIDLLPPRPLALLASADGYGPLRRSLELAEGERRDLGVLELTAGASLPVAVTDEQGAAVAGASVRLPGREATTDDEGLAVLTDLAAGSDVDLQATAHRFLPAELELRAPWPPQVEIRLTRVFLVRGRFVAVDGAPFAAANVRIAQGRSFRFQDLEPDGSFELELPPHVGHTLRFASPAARERIVELAPGLPGEELDLGLVQPPPGVVAWGRIVSAVDGSPIVGARVWMPRPSDDPLGAWLHGDLIETRSDGLGSFELGGLQSGPAIVRIDADGFSRLHVDVQARPDDTAIDLGTFELSPGATLRIVAGEDRTEGALARFDMRGEWMDLDMLTASLVDGAAEIPHVPAGPGLLTVLALGELLCERRLVVAEGEDELEVECATGPEITGIVIAGDRAAGSGTLVWSAATEAPVKATILNRTTPLGVRQQQTLGIGRPPVRVEVAEDGTFSSDRLTAGRWSVGWFPANGLPAAPRPVEVPAGEGAHVVVRIDGGRIAGRVLDGNAVSVEGAWVRELTSGAVARSDTDGGFLFTGLSAGEARLQARDGERFSEVARVWIDEERPPGPVDLVLDEDHEGRLAIQVWTGEDLPAADALVFVDSPGRGLQVVSADGRGRAALTLAAPYPAQLRIAVFHDGRWGFSGWRDWTQLSGGVFDHHAAGDGEILVTSEASRSRVQVTAPDGLDLTAALALLGANTSVSPERDLLLSGLPSGVYGVALPTATPSPVAISESRRSARVELD